MKIAYKRTMIPIDNYSIEEIYSQFKKHYSTLRKYAHRKQFIPKLFSFEFFNKGIDLKFFEGYLSSLNREEKNDLIQCITSSTKGDFLLSRDEVVDQFVRESKQLARYMMIKKYGRSRWNKISKKVW